VFGGNRAAVRTHDAFAAASRWRCPARRSAGRRARPGSTRGNDRMKCSGAGPRPADVIVSCECADSPTGSSWFCLLLRGRATLGGTYDVKGRAAHTSGALTSSVAAAAGRCSGDEVGSVKFRSSARGVGAGPSRGRVIFAETRSVTPLPRTRQLHGSARTPPVGENSWRSCAQFVKEDGSRAAGDTIPDQAAPNRTSTST